MKIFLPLITVLLTGMVLYAAPALATEAQPWQLGLQPAASPVMEEMTRFHNMLMVIITAISLFVLALLLIVIFRFNKKANPVPSTRSHHFVLEVVWTVVPVLILAIIVIPSFKLLYFTERVVDADMTVKVVGYQWFWGYEYPDHGDIAFNSYMIPDADIDPSKGEIRLLSVDNPLVLPTETKIRFLVTAQDVLHSFAIPSMGVKRDAVPGRLNETWTQINAPGVYYGQCSELCGTGHAYMPSEIIAVPKEQFETWAEMAQEDLEGAYAWLDAQLLPEQTAAVTGEDINTASEEIQ